MSLDIVSYGRKGPGDVLRFSSDEIAQIRRTVDRAPEVMVKVTGGGRDASSVQVHLDYIGRQGKLPSKTTKDAPIKEETPLANSQATGSWISAKVSTSPSRAKVKRTAVPRSLTTSCYRCRKVRRRTSC